MARKKSIGQAELEVLKYIAERDHVTVREVADHFAESKGYVRPTVLKMMERLRKKEFLQRESLDGVFVYRSLAGSEELGQTLIDDFVHGALDGSVSPMVAYLVRKGQMSQDDIQQIRNLVDRLEKEEGGK